MSILRTLKLQLMSCLPSLNDESQSERLIKSFPQDIMSFPRLNKSFHQNIICFPRLNKSFPRDNYVEGTT